MPEFRFQEQTDWHNLNRWREVQPNGSATMLDPATGQPGVYKWVRSDPRVALGVDFILSHSSQIEVTIVRGSHQPDSVDTKMHALTAVSDICAIEGLGMYDSGSNDLRPDNSFFERKVNAAKAADVPVFCYDAQPNSGVDLDRLIGDMTALWHPAYQGHPTQDNSHISVVDKRDWLLVGAALREPYIFGMFGYGLRNRWAQIGKPSVKAVLGIGARHDIAYYFGAAGVSVSEVFEGEKQPRDVLVSAVIQAGVIPAQLRLDKKTAGFGGEMTV